MFANNQSNPFGYYQITMEQLSKLSPVLALAVDPSSNGVVLAESDPGDAYQLWQINLGLDTFTLVNVATGQCAEASGGDGGPVFPNNLSSPPNNRQRWTKGGSGWVALRPDADDGQNMTAESRGPWTAGTKIITQGWDDTENQHWYVTPVLFGAQQSPVDLRDAVQATVALELHWQPGTKKVDSHNEKMTLTNCGYLMLDSVEYTLKQAHIHKPCEHTVPGQNYAGEIHLVHASDVGDLAVVAIFVNASTEKAAWFEQLTSSDDHFDPNVLLPADRSFYRYKGSLTTPPYSENVIWSVLKTPISASTVQLGLTPENARQTQDLNRRYILSGT